MMLTLTDAEVKTFDTELEPVLEWAKTRSAEAEQLALDCARLLSCTEDRLDQIKGQGFFQRCWGRLSGKTGEMERANTSDLIQMQKVSLRYIGLLQERQLMMAHAMLTLRNNLVTLSIKEEETRLLLSDLAENTLRRFQALESRVDQLEVSVNIQGWVLTLEDRDYGEKFPGTYLRLLKVVNDFFMYKNDSWNYQDILFLKKSLRIVEINPRESISIKEFVSGLINDIKLSGFNAYEDILLKHKADDINNFSKFILDNISSQMLITLHGLYVNYVDRSDIIETLSEELSISSDSALNKLILRSIALLNVDIESTLSFADIAVEILSGMRLANCLNKDAFVQTMPIGVDGPSFSAGSLDKKEDFSLNANVVGSGDSSAAAHNISFDLAGDDSLKNSSNFTVDQEAVDNLHFSISQLPLNLCSKDLYKAPKYEVYNFFKFKNSYVFVLELNGREFIYLSTSDFKHFKKLDVDPSYYCVECNGRIFAFLGGYICFKACLVSLDFISWTKIDLGSQYIDRELGVFDVFFVDDKWVLAANYTPRYVRVKQGFFKDTEEQRGVNSAIFFVSSDLEEWESCDFAGKFPKFNINNICIYKNEIIVFGYIDLASQVVLLRSSACLDWEEIPLPREMHNVDRVHSFAGHLYLFDFGKPMSKTLDFSRFDSWSIQVEMPNFRAPASGWCKDFNVCLSDDLCVYKNNDMIFFTNNFINILSRNIPGHVLQDKWVNFLIFIQDGKIILANKSEFILIDS
jgi:hypothetical protein